MVDVCFIISLICITYGNLCKSGHYKCQFQFGNRSRPIRRWGTNPNDASLSWANHGTRRPGIKREAITILEHREVIAGQTADVLAGPVSHRDGERYHVDAALEGGALQWRPSLSRAVRAPTGRTRR